MLIADVGSGAEKKYLLDVIPEFFARDPEQGPLNCTRAAGRIDFLHAPLFATHGDVRPAVPTLQCTPAPSNSTRAAAAVAFRLMLAALHPRPASRCACQMLSKTGSTGPASHDSQ